MRGESGEFKGMSRQRRFVETFEGAFGPRVVMVTENTIQATQ